MKKSFFIVFSLFISALTFGQDSLNVTRQAVWNPAGMPSNGSTTYNDCWGYTTPTGEEYAIIGNVDSILVLDVTNCDDPVRVFGYNGGNTTTWRDFKTYGDYLYAVCDVNCSEGLHIFDMSALPGGAITHELTTTAFFTKAHNIYIDEAEARLYAAGVPGGTDVTVLDLSVTPENPTLLKHVNYNDVTGTGDNFYVHDIYVRGDTAYCSHGYLGFYVWDMDDLNNISLLGDMDTGGYNHSSWTTADASYAYYAEEVPTGRKMGIMDLANVGSPTMDIDTVGTFVDPLEPNGLPTPHNPFVHDGLLYISYYEDGIKIYDVEDDPLSPDLVGYYDTYTNNGNSYNGYDGCWGIYPFFDSGCIIASDGDYGLNTFNYGVDCDVVNEFYTGLIADGTITYANEYIEAEGYLPSNFSAEFYGQDSVVLLPGFETIGTAEFEAAIEDCLGSGAPIIDPDHDNTDSK